MSVGECTDCCYEGAFSLVCAKHNERKHEIENKDKIVNSPDLSCPDNSSNFKLQSTCISPTSANLLEVETVKNSVKDYECQEVSNSENMDEYFALELDDVLVEGRSAVKRNNISKTMSYFHKAVELLKKIPKLCEKYKSDLVDFKFVCGYVCYKCYTLESMNTAITLFKEIIKSKEKNLGPVYYLLGLSFRKFHKFQIALTYFETLSSMNEEAFDFNVSDWLDEDSLRELKYESIQSSLRNEIIICKCPPPPDAICRFKSCDFVAIYFSDLSYKKCACLHCQERCIVQYHIACWKSIKDTFPKNDKDFLDGPCFTPDCDGLIIKIEIIGKDGLVEKEFVSKGNCKPRKHCKQNQMSLENKVDRKEHGKKRAGSRTISKSSEVDEEFVFEKRHSKENIKYQNSRKSEKMSNESFNDDVKLGSYASVTAEGSNTKSDTNEKTSIKDEDIEYKCFLCPNAVCRYKDCTINHLIYFDDPLFQLYICVHCQELCAIQYHVSCWKIIKKSFSKTDDEFLGCPCFTLDCNGVITKVDIVGRDGVFERHFVSEDSYKPKKRVKQRKVKLQKKQEQKEHKKQRVPTSLLSGNFENWIDETEPATKNTDSNELNARYQTKKKAKETYVKDVCLNVDENKQLGFATSGITKSWRNKPDNEKECDNKPSTYREFRAQSKYSPNIRNFPNAYSIPYSTKWKFVSSNVPNDFEKSNEIETAWNAHDFSEDDYEEELKATINSKFASSNVPNDFEKSNEIETALNAHDFPEDDYEEELEATINSHFINFLQCHGFVNISDPNLYKEICSLSLKANQLIDKKGGFLSFFQNSAEFVILNDNFCLFDDVKDFYASGFDKSANQSAASKLLKDLSSNSHPVNKKKVQPIASKNNDMFNCIELNPLEYAKNIEEFSEINATNNQTSDKYVNNTDMCTGVKKYEVITAVYSDIKDQESSSEESLPHEEAFRHNFKYSYKLSRNNGNLFSSQTSNIKNGSKSHSVIDVGKKMQESSKTQLAKAKCAKCPSKLHEYVADSSSLVRTEEKSKIPQDQNVKYLIPQQRKPNDFIADMKGETETSVKDIEDPKTVDSTLEEKLLSSKRKESINGEEKLYFEKEISHTKEKNLITQKQEQLQNKTEEKSETQTKVPQSDERLKNAELQILNMKKSEYTRDFKLRLSSVETNIQELRSGLRQMEYMYRIGHSNITLLQDKLNEYTNDMCAAHLKSMEEISDQIKAVENGTSLSELTKMRTPTFPPLPTMDTVLSEMKAQQISPTSMQQAFANSLQNNGQLPPMSFQNLFLQNLQEIAPCGINLAVEDCDVPMVNGYRSQRTSSSSRSTTSVTAQAEASVSELPYSYPIKDFFDDNAMTAFNGKYSQQTSSTSSNVSSTIKEKSLPLNSKNRQSKHSLSSEIFEDGANSLLRTKSSRESISSGSYFDYEDSGSSKGTPSNSVKRTTSSIEKNSTAKSSHHDGNDDIGAEFNSYEKKERLKATFHKIVATLKQEFPDATNSEIASALKEYKTTVRGQDTKPQLAAAIVDITKIIRQARKKTMPDVGNSEPAVASFLATDVEAAISDLMKKNLESMRKHVLNPQKSLDTPNDLENLSSCPVIASNVSSQLLQHSKQDGENIFNTIKDVLVRRDSDSSRNSPKSASIPRTKHFEITAPRNIRPKLLTKKPLTSCSKPAPSPVPEPTTPPFTAWATNPTPNDKSNWNRECTEHCCSICLEEMTVITAYRVECGHKFHLECIKKWFRKQSNCPCCRVHLLLPEEFPQLF